MAEAIRAADGAGVWTGRSLGGKDALCFDLQAQHLSVLDTALRSVHERGLKTEQIGIDDFDLTPIDAQLRDLVAEVRDGHGLLVVRGFPVDRYSLAELETVYWGFGLRFGDPVSQSVLGDRLGHVVDVTDVDPNARAYRNNRELSLHTDFADMVSFLCVRKAKVGGESWFSSALAVHNEILATRPDLLDILYHGFPWYRSGEHADDSEPVTPWRVPVLSARDGQVSCRYVREYIMEATAHEGGVPLSEQDIEALDFFDDVAHRDGMPVHFTLEPGEAVFINNLTVLHARTKFESDSDSTRRRLLLRLWTKMRDGRPTVPELKIFDGENEHGIPAQPGRMPSYAGLTSKRTNSRFEGVT